MEVKEINRKLPRGTVNEIARKTGLSTATVSNVLRGKARRSANAATVYRAAAEYITDYNLQKAEAMQALNEAMSD
jgi:DNA-binding LacI/PurR family transcriptional regulator